MNTKIKKVAAGLVVCALGLGLMGCEDSKHQEASYTEDLMLQANAAVGFPNVTNFFEKAQLKEIYEMRDNPNLICYWYTKNDMTGKWIYQGECIGYGIPYTTSITCPEERVYSSTTLPLAEPNGLYSSPSTSATWVLAEDGNGGCKPIYVESEISVSQVKLDKRLCESWSIPSDY